MKKLEKKASYKLSGGRWFKVFLTQEYLEEQGLNVWHYQMEMYNPSTRKDSFPVHMTFGSAHELSLYVDAMEKATFLMLDGNMLLLPRVTNPWNVGVGSNPADFVDYETIPA